MAGLGPGSHQPQTAARVAGAHDPEPERPERPYRHLKIDLAAETEGECQGSRDVTFTDRDFSPKTRHFRRGNARLSPSQSATGPSPDTGKLTAPESHTRHTRGGGCCGQPAASCQWHSMGAGGGRTIQGLGFRVEGLGITAEGQSALSSEWLPGPRCVNIHTSLQEQGLRHASTAGGCKQNSKGGGDRSLGAARSG